LPIYYEKQEGIFFHRLRIRTGSEARRGLFPRG